MKRFIVTFSVLVALAVVASGCNVSSTPPVAGQVDGASITTAKLDGLMQALKSDGPLLCLSGDGKNPITTGAGTGTWNEAYADYVLAQLIKFQVLENLVVARHVYVPGSDMSVAKAQIAASLTGDSAAGCGNAATALAQAGSTFQDDLVANQLNIDAYSAQLAGTSLQPGMLASWEQAHPGSIMQSCTSVIQLSSHSEAIKIAAAINAGANFATEADAHTQATSTAKGGVVGCVLEKQWTGGLGPTVAALPLSKVSSPVHFGAGWLLFFVSKRIRVPPPAVLSVLASDEMTAFGARYAAALSTAHVMVSPVYGSWLVAVSKAGVNVTIVPPSDKSCAYSLAATAAGCATTTTSTISGTAPAGSG